LSSGLAYTTHGNPDGTPLVLLHSLALDHSVWDRFLPFVVDAHTVVTCDLPGHGQSPLRDELSIEGMADEVAELIEQVADGASARVVGMSMGGCVALALAQRHPSRVRALGLVDTTAWYGPDAPQTWEGRAVKARDEGLGSLAGFQLDRWFTRSFRSEHPKVGEALLDVFRANDLDSYVASCRAMGAFDLRPGLKDISAPTVVAVGEQDMATPPDFARVIAAEVPGAELHVLAGCAHLSAVERPHDVATALGRVLTQG